MKKLLERLQSHSDRAKLLGSIALVVLVLVAAMLLPLSFRSEPGAEEPPAPLTLEERAQMFADYRTGAAGTEFSVEKPDPVPQRMQQTCETVMRTLIARAINDQGLAETAPTGSEYTIVTDGEGRELHLCRMWLERRGDWQNWMDVFMDADTGELYYFYLSRECLTNRKNYPLTETPDAAQIAELLTAENGWTLRHLTAEEDGSAVAVCSTPGGTVCFSIACRVYDALIDVKLACR